MRAESGKRRVLGRCIDRLCRDQGGVAAAEFALLSPILFFIGLGTVDLGLALTERMTIDHILRSGANVAMDNAGIQSVRKVLEAAAKKNFTVGAGEYSISFSVDYYFACPADPEIEVTATTECAPEVPPSTYYRLSATKTYAGIIIPDLGMNPALKVQVR